MCIVYVCVYVRLQRYVSTFRRCGPVCPWRRIYTIHIIPPHTHVLNIVLSYPLSGALCVPVYACSCAPRRWVYAPLNTILYRIGSGSHRNVGQVLFDVRARLERRYMVLSIWTLAKRWSRNAHTCAHSHAHTIRLHIRANKELFRRKSMFCAVWADGDSVLPAERPTMLYAKQTKAALVGIAILSGHLCTCFMRRPKKRDFWVRILHLLVVNI